MKWTQMIALLFAMTGSGIASGDLIITEFMADSSAVPDAEGEYFELYNSGPLAIDIGSLTIQDDGSDSLDLISFAGTFINPGAFVVFGNEPTANAAHVDIDYSSIGSYFLANSADEIVVVDTASSTELSRLVYTDGDVFGDGVANVLDNITSASGGVTQESDYIAETAANNTLTNGDIGSPGAFGSTAIPEPSSLTLLGIACLAATCCRRRR